MGKSGSFFHTVAATAAAGKPIRAQSRAGFSVDNMTPRETISLSSGQGGNVGITGPAWSYAEWAGSLGTINPALLDLCWVKCRYVTTDTAALNLTGGTSKKTTTKKQALSQLCHFPAWSLLTRHRMTSGACFDSHTIRFWEFGHFPSYPYTHFLHGGVIPSHELQGFGPTGLWQLVDNVYCLHGCRRVTAEAQRRLRAVPINNDVPVQHSACSACRWKDL